VNLSDVLICDHAARGSPRLTRPLPRPGNHVGFYVAKYQGLYSAADLDVTLLSPHLDAYKATPAARVEDGTATFAVTPSESVISHHTWPTGAPQPKAKLRAVAALLQTDTSAIVTLASSGIDRPAKLQGKRYASYSARYEGRIVQELIRADGGSGDYQELSLPMLGVWDTLLTGQADATWVFMQWEGIEARRKGVDLNVFKLGDYGIPYGYSPTLVAHPSTLEERGEEVRAFLAATAEGYKLAAADPAAAAAALTELATAENPDLPSPLDPGLVEDSVKEVAPLLLDGAGRWGSMDAARWDIFLDWLSSKGLLTTKVQSREPVEGISTTLDALRSGGGCGEPVPRSSVLASALFTNDFLP
jgi:ABC-type nitrate/sulfonate/bicarbonate transport system substrate-binding protein